MFKDIDSNSLVQFDYSSVKPIRDNIQSSMAPPNIQTIALDNDRDGKIDQLNVTMRLKKPKSSLNLQNFNMIMAFDYELKDMIRMKMEGLAYVQIDAFASRNLNAGSITTQGSLNLVQPNALNLLPDGFDRTIYDDDYFDKIEKMSI